MEEDYNSSYTGLQIDTAVKIALSLDYEVVTPNIPDPPNSN
jgi:hypothetical protein